MFRIETMTQFQVTTLESWHEFFQKHFVDASVLEYMMAVANKNGVIWKDIEGAMEAQRQRHRNKDTFSTAEVVEIIRDAMRRAGVKDVDAVLRLGRP